MIPIDIGRLRELDSDIEVLRSQATSWARLAERDRIEILRRVKDGVMEVAEQWVDAAAAAKQIPSHSPLVGEEWMSGPYAVMAACDLLIETLSMMDGRAYLDALKKRTLANGQLAVTVAPNSVWDRVLLSGVHAEVWMQPGVTAENLGAHTAGAYAVSPGDRSGKVALVLGAGNIAAITPLDVFHKLFTELQVVVLKMNPVNEYLTPFIDHALKPLIDIGALRVVTGDGQIGAYLSEHHEIDEVHITGSGHTHDLIVWGSGREAQRNRADGTPRLTKRVTSELGAVCPTIVVPGAWSKADIRFQAEQIATQKMHNSGFNCVACQVLVLPQGWDLADCLVEEIERVVSDMPQRGLYYPGADERLATFADRAENLRTIERLGGESCLVAEHLPGSHTHEVFAPALSVVRLAGTGESFLQSAIEFANESLHGTLGANIVIDPATLKEIGNSRFDNLISGLRYGAIAVNTWTALSFLMNQATWGAFPGHTLDDVQSGIGVVHNSFMFDRPERTIVRAPFRPFPRNLRHRSFTLLPRPPWFVTNTQAAKLGRLLVEFQHRPSWAKVPRIFGHALKG